MTQTNWIYHFDQNGNIIRNESIMNILPKLRTLPDDIFKYYVLAYDYVRSPYKFRPEDEAKLMAARMAFKEDNFPEEDPEVVEELRSVIYDEKIETVRALRNRIHFLNLQLIDETDTSKMTANISTCDKLQAMLDRKLEEIKEAEEDIKLTKGRELSLIEKMQRSKKIYQMRVANVRDIQTDNKE